MTKTRPLRVTNRYPVLYYCGHCGNDMLIKKVSQAQLLD